MSFRNENDEIIVSNNSMMNKKVWGWLMWKNFATSRRKAAPTLPFSPTQLGFSLNMHDVSFDLHIAAYLLHGGQN